jgi:hypothetical protein
MNIMPWCLLIFSVLGMIFSAFMLKRTEEVFNFRLDIISRILSGKNSTLDLKNFEKVSYDTMVGCFWKPLETENFYKDKFSWEVEVTK